MGTYGYSAYYENGVSHFMGVRKPTANSAEEGELIAIREGLKGALHEGYLKTFMLSDSRNCINAIKGLLTVLHQNLCDIVREIQLLCTRFEDIYCEYVDRNHLLAAHKMASGQKLLVLHMYTAPHV